MDVWNFSLPNAIVTKQLLVPFLPLVNMPLALSTAELLVEGKKTEGIILLLIDWNDFRVKPKII